MVNLKNAVNCAIKIMWWWDYRLEPDPVNLILPHIKIKESKDYL